MEKTPLPTQKAKSGEHPAVVKMKSDVAKAKSESVLALKEGTAILDHVLEDYLRETRNRDTLPSIL